MCVLNSYSHAEITEISYSHSPLIILISHRHPRRLDNQPPQVCFNIARIALIRGLGSCLIGNSGYVIIKFICTSGFGFQVYSSTSFLPHIQSIYLFLSPSLADRGLSCRAAVLLPGQPENIRRGRKNRTSSSKPAHFPYQLPMHPRHSVRNGVGRSDIERDHPESLQIHNYERANFKLDHVSNPAQKFFAKLTPGSGGMFRK